MIARCTTTIAGVAVTGSRTSTVCARGGLTHSAGAITARVRHPLPANAARSTTRIASRYLRGTISGVPLPENDGTRWTIPDQTPPDILSMRFKIDDVRLPNRQVVQCPIELSDRGGYLKATLTYRLRRVEELNPAWHARLIVTYKTVELFRGRLEEITMEVEDDLVRTMVFTGPINQLSDHKAFRRVYVDSDLDSWQTGQGPQTASSVWEVQAV